MKSTFIAKVKKYYIVDTRLYRYVYDPYRNIIVRIPILYIGITSALDDENWEVVKQL